VLVRGASGDDPVALEASTIGPLDCATLEGAGFVVVTNAVIHGEVVGQLPGVLEIEAVDVIFRSHGAGAGAERESCSGGVGRVDPVLAKMELLEQREPGIVADVEPRLPGVGAVGPSDVVNVLIALVQAALRAAEVSPADQACPGVDCARLCGLIR